MDSRRDSVGVEKLERLMISLRQWSWRAPAVLAVIAVLFFSYGFHAAHRGGNEQGGQREATYRTPNALENFFSPANDFAAEYEKIFIVFGTLAIAWFTGTLWWSTKQLWVDAAANTRPWIVLKKLTPYGNLTAGKDGNIRFYAKLTVTNIGKIPARMNWTLSSVVLEPNGLKWIKPLLDLRKGHKRWSADADNWTDNYFVIPGADFETLPWEFNLPADEIAKASGIREAKGEAGITPMIIGAITYKPVGSETIYETGLIATLQFGETNLDWRAASFVVPIPGEHYRFAIERGFMAGFAT